MEAALRNSAKRIQIPAGDYTEREMMHGRVCSTTSSVSTTVNADGYLANISPVDHEGKTIRI